MNSNINVAIESAVGGGSLAIARGDAIIATCIGDTAVSRAEDILFNLDRLLTSLSIEKSEIDTVAVSVGPGSFTGIRIGLATAMGLCASIGVAMKRYSILDAMAASTRENDIFLTAVPLGRGVFCSAMYERRVGTLNKLSEPKALGTPAFEQQSARSGIRVVMPEAFADGLAVCLVTAALNGQISQANEPLFISKPESV